MDISATLVKELRERTGAGMMECKKALVETHGDIEAAIEVMRKTGMAKAAKKAGRIASEGVIIIKTSHDRKCAVMLEVNCETDFVGRDSSFKAFAEAVATCALAGKINDVAKLAALPIAAGSQTIEEARLELSNKLGENIQLRRIALINASGVVGEYTHGGRIGALVALTKDNPLLGKDIAMHITAANPQALSPKDVGADLIAKEREIFTAQSETSGKPKEIIDKMIDGRIKKFLSEISLLDQPFIKDPSRTVASLLSTEQCEATAFARFEVGEGIEKNVEDFAEAVRAQISGGNA